MKNNQPYFVIIFIVIMKSLSTHILIKCANLPKAKATLPCRKKQQTEIILVVNEGKNRYITDTKQSKKVLHRITLIISLKKPLKI